jgi:hypothetical protein
MQITRKSMITGLEHTLDLPVTPEQMAAYENGALLQVAFPDLDAPNREFIKTGVTPEEWKEHVVGSGPRRRERRRTDPRRVPPG